MSGFVWGFLINPFEVYDRFTAKGSKEKYNQLVSRIKYAIIELNNEQKYQEKLEQEYKDITKYVFMYFWAPHIEVPSIPVIKSFIIQNINKNFDELIKNHDDTQNLTPTQQLILDRQNASLKKRVEKIYSKAKNEIKCPCGAPIKQYKHNWWLEKNKIFTDCDKCGKAIQLTKGDK